LLHIIHTPLKSHSHPFRTTVATIDLAALRGNFRSITKCANERRTASNLHPLETMPIVKADAYGHGIVQCARALLSEGASMLGVAFAAEAEPLRAASVGIPPETRIAVVTPPFAGGAAEYCRLNLEFCAASLETVQAFSAEAAKTGRTLYAHLTLDTGMHRDGIPPHEAVEFMRSIEHLPNIVVHGICTHFATSDEAEPSFFHLQCQRFQGTLLALQNAGYDFRYVHAANSGAIASGFANTATESIFTLVRPGIALYGYNPSPDVHEPLSLQPVMSLTTSIISLRRLPGGEPVSYGRRYFTTRETTIATIPIGYADGFRRGLTGKARVIIGGALYPVVGTICMDQCMVDIGDAPLSVGAPVTLLGEDGNSSVRIDADEWASLLGTISYEVLTGITARVPRVYVG
jgi:alanine racemase